MRIAMTCCLIRIFTHCVLGPRHNALGSSASIPPPVLDPMMKHCHGSILAEWWWWMRLHRRRGWGARSLYREASRTTASAVTPSCSPTSRVSRNGILPARSCTFWPIPASRSPATRRPPRATSPPSPRTGRARYSDRWDGTPTAGPGRRRPVAFRRADHPGPRRLTGGTMTGAAPALGRFGVWSTELRVGDPASLGAVAAGLTGLGYTTLWMPGRTDDLFDVADRYLGAASDLVVASGVASIWLYGAPEAAAATSRLNERHGGRFLLGLGVSHAPLVNNDRAAPYRHPLAHMEHYLDELEEAGPGTPTVIAALGPRMLELAGRRSLGTHPYLVTPDHTALARQALGPDKIVAVCQTATIESDPAAARSVLRRELSIYLGLPNYVQQLAPAGLARGRLLRRWQRPPDRLSFRLGRRRRCRSAPARTSRRRRDRTSVSKPSAATASTHRSTSGGWWPRPSRTDPPYPTEAIAGEKCGMTSSDIRRMDAMTLSRGMRPQPTLRRG